MDNTIYRPSPNATTGRRAKGFKKQLKNKPTMCEHVFGERLRKITKRLGVKYKFGITEQLPIFVKYNKFYIVDFAIRKLKLIFEIDGSVHEKQESYDTKRDIELMNFGYSVYRINNSDIYCDIIFETKINEILKMIKDRCKTGMENKGLFNKTVPVAGAISCSQVPGSSNQ